MSRPDVVAMFLNLAKYFKVPVAEIRETFNNGKGPRYPTAKDLLSWRQENYLMKLDAITLRIGQPCIYINVTPASPNYSLYFDYVSEAKRVGRISEFTGIDTEFGNVVSYTRETIGKKFDFPRSTIDSKLLFSPKSYFLFMLLTTPILGINKDILLKITNEVRRVQGKTAIIATVSTSESAAPSPLDSSISRIVPAERDISFGVTTKYNRTIFDRYREVQPTSDKLLKKTTYNNLGFIKKNVTSQTRPIISLPSIQKTGQLNTIY
jgi:hypothetical protein